MYGMKHHCLYSFSLPDGISEVDDDNVREGEFISKLLAMPGPGQAPDLPNP